MQIADIYLTDYNRVKGIYNYDPANADSFRQRAEVLDSRTLQHRAELVEILSEYNVSLGCGQETLNNLKSLADSKTLTVVTGQQAGLFTGPLYTIYKACSAILLAENLSAKLKRRIVPVFWVASEDHDFLEVNHAYIWTVKGKTKKIAITKSPCGKPSIGEIEIPEDWEALIRDLSYYTPETENKREMLNLLAEAARNSKDLADWFTRIMTGIFRPYGLIFIDPMLKGVRHLLRGALATALQSHQKINHALHRKENRLLEIGFSAPISKEENSTNLFYYHQENRISLMAGANGDYYLSSAPEISFDKGSLLDLMEAEPTKFSPNVVLRPIFQDLLLPTICYVAGPGEIAYYGQLSEVYPIFGLEMPIIYPRKRLTVIDRDTNRLMTKYNLTYQLVSEKGKAALSEYLEQKLPIDVDGEFKDFREEMVKEYEKLVDKIVAIDENLLIIGKENLRRINNQLNYLQKKAWQKHRRNNKDIVTDFEKVQEFLYPTGKPQERVYNVIPFLMQTGQEFIKILMKDINIKNFEHQVLVIGDDF